MFLFFFRKLFIARCRFGNKIRSGDIFFKIILFLIIVGVSILNLILLFWSNDIYMIFKYWSDEIFRNLFFLILFRMVS